MVLKPSNLCDWATKQILTHLECLSLYACMHADPYEGILRGEFGSIIRRGYHQSVIVSLSQNQLQNEGCQFPANSTDRFGGKVCVAGSIVGLAELPAICLRKRQEKTFFRLELNPGSV